MLERRFKRVPGVVDVTRFGGRSKSYNVVIDLARMNAHGLSLPEVIGAMRAGNVTVGAGTIRIGPQAAVVQGWASSAPWRICAVWCWAARTATRCCWATSPPSRLIGALPPPWHRRA